ncbi:MAG: hypothetical protein RXR04_06785 [Caldivirga sp.]
MSAWSVGFGVINPHILPVLRTGASRLGVWWRVSPLRRGLMDSVILFIRRGGVVESPGLLAAIRQAALEVLTLMLSRRLTLVAYLIGLRLLGRVRQLVGGIRAVVALGIMWINTPNWYRPDIAP